MFIEKFELIHYALSADILAEVVHTVVLGRMGSRIVDDYLNIMSSKFALEG